MRRSKKILHGILCCATALSLCTALPAVTYAENTTVTEQSVEDDEEAFVFVVNIFDLAAVYPTNTDVVYPGAPSASDLSVTLTTTSGKKITEPCTLTTNGRMVRFELSSAKELEKYTLTLNTDDTVMSFGSGFDYAFFDDTTQKASGSIGGTYEDTQAVYEYGTKKVDDQIVIDYEGGEKLNENKRSLNVVATMAHTGLNSVTLCYNEHEELDTPNAVGPGIYKVREEYGIDHIISAKVYVNDEFYSDAVRGGKGIFYFVTPVEWSDEEYAFKCPDDLELTMVVHGFNSAGYKYTVELPLANWSTTPLCANTYGMWLNQFNVVLDAYEEESEDAPDIENPYDAGGEDVEITLPDTDVFSNQLNINIDSKLSQFRKEMLHTAVDESVALLGLPTPTYKTQFMGMTFTDNVPVTWDTVSLASEKKIGVDEGTYTLTTDSRITLLNGDKPISEIKVTAKGDKKYNLTATPRYTLTLDSLLQGDFAFTVDGQELTGTGTELFMLEPNVNYMLVDKATGKQYSVLATDDTPHLKVTLGSDQGSIGTTNPTDFEDVPNTADFMTIVFAILGGIVAALAAAAGIVFFKMKRSNK